MRASFVQLGWPSNVNRCNNCPPAVKRREVARVTVYSRHPENWKRSEETNNACMCPKWARYFRNGKMTRISLDTCDEETADTKAAELTMSLKAANEGKPAPERAKGKLLEDAVQEFLRTKEQSGVRSKTRGQVAV